MKATSTPNFARLTCYTDGKKLKSAVFGWVVVTLCPYQILCLSTFWFKSLKGRLTDTHRQNVFNASAYQIFMDISSDSLVIATKQREKFRTAVISLFCLLQIGLYYLNTSCMVFQNLFVTPGLVTRSFARHHVVTADCRKQGSTALKWPLITLRISSLVQIGQMVENLESGDTHTQTHRLRFFLCQARK